MRILRNESLGLIIDIQERLYPHIYEHEAIAAQTAKLIEAFTILALPTLVTEQYTKGLGPTIPAIANALGKYQALEKMAFSCCDDKNFDAALATHNRRNVIIAGIETHVCVLQTSLDLIAKGYQPVIVADCVSSRKENDKIWALERLKQEGAIITTFESIVFELTRYSGTDEFKRISKLVK